MILRAGSPQAPPEAKQVGGSNPSEGSWFSNPSEGFFRTPQKARRIRFCSNAAEGFFVPFLFSSRNRNRNRPSHSFTLAQTRRVKARSDDAPFQVLLMLRRQHEIDHFAL